MKNLHTWSSDVENEENMIDNIKRRTFQQKFFYFGTGAKKYYEAYGEVDENREQYLNFIEDFFEKNKDKKIALISLGCGNANPETPMLEALEQRKINVDYYGVDSSKEMIDLAVKNLAKINLKKNFIISDITTRKFSKKIALTTKDYDIRIYMFLGSTFGNPNQTSITDSLYNMLQGGDFLWLDVLSRSDDSHIHNYHIFERYEKYLEDKKMMDFQFSPLQNIGLLRSDGEISISSINEPSIGAMKYIFQFTFKKHKEILLKDELIHILPEETIPLLTIRNYHSPTLIHFFKQHNFILINNKMEGIKNRDGIKNPYITIHQFLFQKSK